MATDVHSNVALIELLLGSMTSLAGSFERVKYILLGTPESMPGSSFCIDRQTTGIQVYLSMYKFALEEITSVLLEKHLFINDKL